MNYKYIMNNIKFVAKEKDINNEIKKLEFFHKALINSDRMNPSLIIINHKKLEKEIIEKLKQIGYLVYDLSSVKNHLNSIDNKDLMDIMINDPVCLIKTVEHRMFLDDYYKDLAFFTATDSIITKGAIILYNGWFNHCRDGFFRIHKSKVTLILDETEFILFNRCALDYCEYCSIFNFNRHFKYDTLDLFILNKIGENHEPKILRK